MRRADLAAVCALLSVLAACVVSGAPVSECEEDSEGRAMAIVRRPASTDGERSLAIECWRELDPERIEVWFSYPAGTGCWQLSSLELRESADAITISLAAAPAPVCVDDAGAGALTQIELQAPMDDRAVLDASGG